MFADDWDELPENDDHLPFEERAWVKRMRERKAAAERLDREHPHLIETLSRAMAQAKIDLVIKILTGDR